MTQHVPRTLALAILVASLAAYSPGCGGKPGPESPPATEAPTSGAGKSAGPGEEGTTSEEKVPLPEGIKGAALPAGVVATVDGEKISTEEFAGALGAASFTGRQATYKGRLGILLERVDTLLVERAATAAGYLQRPMVARMRDRMRRRYAVWEVRRGLLEKAKVEDAEIDAVFKDPGEILDLTVLLADTREDAVAAIARVRAGEDMGAVAKEVSISPGAGSGKVRRIGLERGEGMYPPDVEEAIFAVPAGALSEPLETPVGWLVVRVDARKRVAAEEIAKLRSSIAENLRMRKAADLIAEAAKGGAVKRLRERYAGSDLPDPEENPAAVWRALEQIRVAEVDGILLTMGDVFRDVQDYRLLQRKTVESREEIYQDMLGRQIEEVRLLARARAEGVDRIPSVEQAVAGYTRTLLAAQYIADIVLGIGEKDLDQDRCRAFFEERRTRFLDDERVDLSQILVRREEQARAIMAELAAGGNFEALAREHSVDKSKGTGGRMSWEREDSLGEIFGEQGAAVLVQRGRDRRVDEILLRTTSGYHIVRVHGLQEIGEGRFEEVRERVLPEFLTFCQQEAVMKRRESLRRAADIVIDEAKVLAIAPSSPAPGSGVVPHGGTNRNPQGGSPHGTMGAPGGSPHGTGTPGRSPHGGMGTPGGASPHGAGAPRGR